MLRKLLFAGFTLLIAGLFLTRAEAQIDVTKIVTPDQQKQIIKNFSDKLEARLKGKSVGYAFVVTYRTNYSEERAGGFARRAPDPNPRAMSVDDKFNIASVSKTITAAAVMKLLAENKIDVDSPVYSYLPTDWTVGDANKKITFRELLTHKSGIRCDTVKGFEVTYNQLKSCFSQSVAPAAKSVAFYQNSNFALFRMIIPRLFLKDVAVPAAKTPSLYYAQIYQSYVQRHVFLPIGLNRIENKPINLSPALAYQFETPVIAGTDFGDMTETSASRGWNMSARELSVFMRNFAFSEKILPASLRDKMTTEGLGVNPINLTRTLSEYGHGGYYPGKDNKTGNPTNPGEMNTLMMAYSNGITVSLIINSQLGPGLAPYSEVKAAMLDMK